MSDVDGVVENGTTEDEFVDANDGEEQDTNLVKKDVKVEITDEDGNVAVNGVAADDDRTEDQVPDITGTDNVDPMTTSMDGIEEIPVNEEAQEEPKEEGGEEIPVEQFEDAPEEPAATEEEPQAQEEEQPVEETPAEEPAAEEPAEEEVAAEEVPAEDAPAEEETPAEEPAEETPAEEPAAEEEQAAEEVPVEEEAAPVEKEAPQEEEAPAEEQPAEKQPAEEGEQQFELQAPPTPKRPRTPNELDNVEHEATPALSGQGSAVASQKGSAPATPRTPTDEQRGQRSADAAQWPCEHRERGPESQRARIAASRHPALERARNAERKWSRGGDYSSYDQDSHRETVPARMPTTQSFSSWNPPERSTYQPISPWVSTANKYANEHTVGVAAHPTSTYTSIFDDLVSTGPFSHSLYSTNRLLERSLQYVRYTSQLPAPLRTREYSTPRSSSVSRVPGRYGSFTSFLDYSGAKQYELSRHGSRGSLYDSTQALSRSNSRGNIDFFLGAGRMSRVDSFVNNLNSRYEYQFPASHDIYHSASRGQISYGPLNQYQTRVGELQRSLSRERFERDRLKNKYSQVSYQLEQAVKQMDLLRTNSYSSVRSGSQPRTSVYSHFYPYY
ncbi:hypothetical protein M3Y99_00389800 [Aphelenchoides fujianensis]|nr:hypothetical protein M3Y99_00389800 [Aphelenchoides fujianensis]